MFDNQDQLINELSSLRDFIRWTMSQLNQHQVFFGHGTDNAWDESVQLVLAAVYLPWDTDPAVLDGKLTTTEKLRVLDFAYRRIVERQPLPYITGEAWFAGLPFNVDERVLIPRSPIAQLIEQHFEPWVGHQPVTRILDMCTGSGCIGIACALAFEEANVDLVDLSPDAIEVAKTNIAKLDVADRVQAIESDLFSNVSGRYDLIVSNPPYVDAVDLANMPAEYHKEPALALGSGDDGLDLTRRMLREANDYLTEQGVLVVEVGNSDVHLANAFPQVPFMWVDLPEGGNGVFVIDAATLAEFRNEF